MNFFTEDQDVLVFPSDEEEFALFLNVSSIPKPRQARSILEQQLFNIKRKSPDKVQYAATLSNILKASPQSKDLERIGVKVGGMINVFEIKQQQQAMENDEFAYAFIQTEQKVKSRKKAQISDHNKPRPRGCPTVLQRQVVLRSGKTEYYTDDEFKRYVEGLGGKTCSQSAARFDILVMCTNYNTSLFEKAQKQFSKKQTEEQFMNYIVNMSVARLEQERQIYKSRLTEEQIGQYIRNLPWCGYEESLVPITLAEIEEFYKTKQRETQQAEELEEERAEELARAAAAGPLRGVAFETKNNANYARVGQEQSNNYCEETLLRYAANQPEKKCIVIGKRQGSYSSVFTYSYSDKSAQSNRNSVAAPAPQMFKDPGSINALIHSRVAAYTLKNELIHLNKPILLSGPTGQGKFLLITCVAKEINFDVVVYNNEIPLAYTIAGFYSPLVRTQRPRVFVIKEVDLLDTRNFTWISKYITDLKRTRFPIVFTTRDQFSSRLRTFKKSCTEIQLYKIGVDAVATFLSTTLQQGSSLSTGYIQRYVERAREHITGDIRQLVLQLNFAFSSNEQALCDLYKTYYIPSINQILINTFTYGKKRKLSLEEAVQQFFVDPQQIMSAGIANYYVLTQGYLKPSIFMAEHFSSADNILFQMYAQGNWAAAKYAAALSLGVPALISPIFYADVEKWGFLQSHYPILGLERYLYTARARDTRITPFTAGGARCCEMELLVRIVDSSFAIGGPDPELAVLSSDDFCELSSIYGADECKGKQRKDLLAWLDCGYEECLMQGKKLVK